MATQQDVYHLLRADSERARDCIHDWNNLRLRISQRVATSETVAARESHEKVKGLEACVAQLQAEKRTLEKDMQAHALNVGSAQSRVAALELERAGLEKEVAEGAAALASAEERSAVGI